MPIDLSAVVVLAPGGLAVHIAHRRPDMGQALGLGAVIVTLLLLLLQPTAAGDAAQAREHPAAGQTGDVCAPHGR
ncbi:hypothetical protein ABT300_41930 [Streptomyces sp. NPDC001027]|uniref:hypothetical protein n=1 Tax=Streptomyces sp. NPDC001027 TaxID=3154771 RepID=UPI00331F694F